VRLAIHRSPCKSTKKGVWNVSTLNVKNTSKGLKNFPYRISVMYKLYDNDKQGELYLTAWVEGKQFFFKPWFSEETSSNMVAKAKKRSMLF
jgi:hypothetical protein